MTASRLDEVLGDMTAAQLNEWLQSQTIQRAKAGDAEAGLEAIRACRDGLEFGNLSRAMKDYLIARLTDIVDGIEPTRALCIAPERGRGQPKNPCPKWRKELGAVAWLLERWGFKPEQIVSKMSDLRAEVEGKNLDPADARKIKKQYQPMSAIEVEMLLHLSGRYRGRIAQYLP
jgi:hypothetical protein